MTPLISIVSGTYNRLSILQQMVESVRGSIPSTIPYEIVLVDGGSNDGTIEWARQQTDIRLIEQGELRGAITAFNEGAYAARGQYVILANDDIVFHQDAILRALVHMEDNPTCGAVAFADDRPNPHKYEVAQGYGVQVIAANPNAAPYAQVGMVRKWLGDICGWWGHLDPVMRNGHTYGGDAYLSARIWELGYTVDAVRGCTVKDLIYRDGLRDHNLREEHKTPALYYQRFPAGPTIAPKPLIPPRDEAQLRVLYLPIYEPGAHYANQKAQKRGLREAFAQVGLVWEVDYINQPFDLVRMADAWQPDILFLQLHSTDEIQANVLAEARRRNPDMLVINWNGDVYARHLLAPGMVDVLRLCDLQACVNGSVLPRYEASGIPAAYWQCAYEPVDENDLPPVPSHDIVFTGNCYSDLRRDFGQFLYSLNGVDIGIYGSGWARSDGNTTYDFRTSRALYKNCKLILGDNQWLDDYGFVSNRVFDVLVAGGGLLLHQHVPGMEEYTGIAANKHYIEWHDLNDLREKVAYWLDPKRDKKRKQIVSRARDFMLTHHSFDARLDELFDTILPTLEQRERVA